MNPCAKESEAIDCGFVTSTSAIPAVLSFPTFSTGSDSVGGSSVMMSLHKILEARTIIVDNYAKKINPLHEIFWHC